MKALIQDFQPPLKSRELVRKLKAILLAAVIVASVFIAYYLASA